MRHSLRGFSTIEIMTALAVIVVTLTAVAEISFGNQRVLVEAQMNAEALKYTEAALEHEESLNKKDFALVGSVATTTDDGYQTVVNVVPWAESPYTTKHIIVETDWTDESGIKRSVELSTLVSDYQSSIGADTCTTPNDVSTPTNLSNYQLTIGDLLPWVPPTGHTFATNNPIATIDAYHGVLYIGVASTSAKTNDSVFTFDIQNAAVAPRYLGSIDTATNTTDGVGALMVAGTYAYIGSAHDPNFKTCKPSANCAQLQIVDVSHPAAPQLVTNFLLPTSSPPYVWGNMTSANQAIGKSIFISQEYVYLGLSKTAHGPEFNIIDVHDPLHPVWLGGYTVGSTVTAITIKNNYAYLATDDSSQDIVILDVHDPNNPTRVGVFDAPDVSGWSNARSLALLGSRLFLGLTYATSSPELYELDLGSPTTPVTIATLNVGSSVVDSSLYNQQLFFVTSTQQQLQTVDISHLANIATTTTSALPGVASSLDCERGMLYAASNSQGRGFVSIQGVTP